MTKRFFYTDPLAAAWMAKHFGMKFKHWRWNDLSFQFTPVNGGSNDAPTHKLYIHPDSLALLRARPRDLLTGTNRRVFMFYDNRIAPTENALVAERNGLPFIWPQSEEALGKTPRIVQIPDNKEKCSMSSLSKLKS
jgi:hypothetical protein